MTPDPNEWLYGTYQELGPPPLLSKSVAGLGQKSTGILEFSFEISIPKIGFRV